MLSPAPSSHSAAPGKAKGGAARHGSAAAQAGRSGEEQPGGNWAPKASVAGALSTEMAAEAPQTAEALEKRIRAVRKKLRQVSDLQVGRG